MLFIRRCGLQSAGTRKRAIVKDHPLSFRAQTIIQPKKPLQVPMVFPGNRSTSARRKVGGTGKLGHRAHAACFRQNQANWECPWKLPWHPLRFLRDYFRGILLLPTYTRFLNSPIGGFSMDFAHLYFAPNPRHAPRPEDPACHPPCPQARPQEHGQVRCHGREERLQGGVRGRFSQVPGARF